MSEPNDTHDTTCRQIHDETPQPILERQIFEGMMKISLMKMRREGTLDLNDGDDRLLWNMYVAEDEENYI